MKVPALQFPISLPGELCLKGGFVLLRAVGSGDFGATGGRGRVDLKMFGSKRELLCRFSLNGFDIIFFLCS